MIGDASLRAVQTDDFVPVAGEPDVGAAPMLQWVKISDLVVDERYQRPIYGAGRTNVRRIAENFRWSKFAPVIVAPIAGGKYAIIDGQHRTTAAQLVGIDQVPAQVIIADLQEQAAAFKAVNGQVTRMHRLAIQAAALTAGDETARELQAVADAAGVTILRYPRAQGRLQAGETMALGAIAEGLRMYGRETVITALTCVTETENNQPGVLSGQMIKGLCHVIGGNNGWREAGEALLRAFDEINLEDEFEEAMTTRRPKGVTLWEVLSGRLKDRLTQSLGESVS